MAEGKRGRPKSPPLLDTDLISWVFNEIDETATPIPDAAKVNWLARAVSNESGAYRVLRGQIREANSYADLMHKLISTHVEGSNEWTLNMVAHYLIELKRVLASLKGLSEMARRDEIVSSLYGTEKEAPPQWQR